MNLSEIKKMITVSLIQERVGFYGPIDGNAAGPADEPDIQGIVDQAEKEIKQLAASQTNLLEAAIAQIAEIIAPALVHAGVDGGKVVQLVNTFSNQIKEAVREARQKKPNKETEMVVNKLGEYE